MKLIIWGTKRGQSWIFKMRWNLKDSCELTVEQWYNFIIEQFNLLFAQANLSITILYANINDFIFNFSLLESLVAKLEPILDKYDITLSWLHEYSLFWLWVWKGVAFLIQISFVVLKGLFFFVFETAVWQAWSTVCLFTPWYYHLWPLELTVFVTIFFQIYYALHLLKVLDPAVLTYFDIHIWRSFWRVGNRVLFKAPRFFTTYDPKRHRLTQKHDSFRARVFKEEFVPFYQMLWKVARVDLRVRVYRKIIVTLPFLYHEFWKIVWITLAYIKNTFETTFSVLRWIFKRFEFIWDLFLTDYLVQKVFLTQQIINAVFFGYFVIFFLLVILLSSSPVLTVRTTRQRHEDFLQFFVKRGLYFWFIYFWFIYGFFNKVMRVEILFYNIYYYSCFFFEKIIFYLKKLRYRYQSFIFRLTNLFKTKSFRLKETGLFLPKSIKMQMNFHKVYSFFAFNAGKTEKSQFIFSYQPRAFFLQFGIAKYFYFRRITKRFVADDDVFTDARFLSQHDNNIFYRIQRDISFEELLFNYTNVGAFIWKYFDVFLFKLYPIMPSSFFAPVNLEFKIKDLLIRKGGSFEKVKAFSFGDFALLLAEHSNELLQTNLLNDTLPVEKNRLSKFFFGNAQVSKTFFYNLRKRFFKIRFIGFVFALVFSVFVAIKQYLRLRKQIQSEYNFLHTERVKPAARFHVRAYKWDFSRESVVMNDELVVCKKRSLVRRSRQKKSLDKEVAILFFAALFETEAGHFRNKEQSGLLNYYQKTQNAITLSNVMDGLVLYKAFSYVKEYPKIYKHYAGRFKRSRKFEYQYKADVVLHYLKSNIRSKFFWVDATGVTAYDKEVGLFFNTVGQPETTQFFFGPLSSDLSNYKYDISYFYPASTYFDKAVFYTWLLDANKSFNYKNMAFGGKLNSHVFFFSNHNLFSRYQKQIRKSWRGSCLTTLPLSKSFFDYNYLVKGTAKLLFSGVKHHIKNAPEVKEKLYKISKFYVPVVRLLSRKKFAKLYRLRRRKLIAKTQYFGLPETKSFFYYVRKKGLLKKKFCKTFKGLQLIDDTLHKIAFKPFRTFGLTKKIKIKDVDVIVGYNTPLRVRKSKLRKNKLVFRKAELIRLNKNLKRKKQLFFQLLSITKKKKCFEKYFLANNNLRVTLQTPRLFYALCKRFARRQRKRDVYIVKKKLFFRSGKKLFFHDFSQYKFFLKKTLFLYKLRKYNVASLSRKNLLSNINLINKKRYLYARLVLFQQRNFLLNSLYLKGMLLEYQNHVRLLERAQKGLTFFFGYYVMNYYLFKNEKDICWSTVVLTRLSMRSLRLVESDIFKYKNDLVMDLNTLQDLKTEREDEENLEEDFNYQGAVSLLKKGVIRRHLGVNAPWQLNNSLFWYSNNARLLDLIYLNLVRRKRTSENLNFSNLAILPYKLPKAQAEYVKYFCYMNVYTGTYTLNFMDFFPLNLESKSSFSFLKPLRTKSSVVRQQTFEVMIQRMTKQFGLAIRNARYRPFVVKKKFMRKENMRLMYHNILYFLQGVPFSIRLAHYTSVFRGQELVDERPVHPDYYHYFKRFTGLYKLANISLYMGITFIIGTSLFFFVLKVFFR